VTDLRPLIAFCEDLIRGKYDAEARRVWHEREERRRARNRRKAADRRRRRR
jgi:hypothetical protein